MVNEILRGAFPVVVRPVLVAAVLVGGFAAASAGAHRATVADHGWGSSATPTSVATTGI